jgi:hypothetical protein
MSKPQVILGIVIVIAAIVWIEIWHARRGSTKSHEVFNRDRSARVQQATHPRPVRPAL